ncbi:MAG TPA: asparagine synthase-related protein [Candidatus Binataceae bacterium]|nr:asparagine synthase-related protein [Candidatus Binataceae bacterium]
MSGFAVIHHLDGRPVERGTLERMLAAIAHRGPDGRGIWSAGAIAMGFAAFHTTPEAMHESQPLADRAGRMRIVFDGRVDNREELAAAISAGGEAPRDDTDAELALCAYRCFGDQAPLRIIGDFAFVVWDAERRELFCARDPIGIRMFHYWCDGRTFVAATELQQLFEYPGMPAEPDDGIAGEYLAGTLIGREATLFRGIKRLPAAHLMVVRGAGPRVRRYFDLLPRESITYRDDTEYAEHFRGLFAEAVRCRMRSVGGVGAHLSGGVDSTSVVGMAEALRREGRVAGGRLETFSLLFDHPDLDERAYIEETVRMLDLAANYPAPMPVTFEMCVETTARYRDFSEYPNGGMWNRLWPAARAKGLKVLLSGTGSDEWLSGTSYVYGDLLRSGRLAALWRRLRADGHRLPDAMGDGMGTLLLRHGLWPIVPLGLRKVIRAVRGRKPYPPFIDAAFARRINLADRLQYEPRPAARMSFAQYAMYENFDSGWVAHGMDMMDRGTAWFGVEERHPFHDRRLYEFLMAIPDDQRARNFKRKFILRNAMRGMVPASVLARRDKADFSILFIQSLERMGGERLFDTMAIAEAGWIDRAEFIRTYRDRTANYLTTNIWPLWTTFSLELWYRMVIRKEAPPLTGMAPVAGADVHG